MAAELNDMAIAPPNTEVNVDLIDEDDILGISEGSQMERGTMDDADEEKTKGNKRKHESVNPENPENAEPENAEPGKRKLRKKSKKDYKKLATGKGHSNPKQKKVAPRTTQQTNPMNEDESEISESDHRQEERPTKETTLKTPPKERVEKQGGKSPMEHRGGKSPMERQGGKSPMEQQGGKSPMDQQGGKSPMKQQGGKSPRDQRGGKSPNLHRDERTSKEDSSSAESGEDSDDETASDTEITRKYQQELREMEERAEDLNRALSKKRKESETNKKNLRLRTKELEETETENRRLRKELEEARRTINTLKRENEEQEEKINIEVRAKNKNKEEIRELKDRLYAEEREKEKYQKVKEEIRKSKTEIQEQLEETKKQLTNTRKKLAEAESMNEELIQKITRESQKSPATTKDHRQERRNKTRVLLIGDSNAKRIKSSLHDDIAWFFTDNTYRIEDINKVDGINEYDCCVTLLGTNNLKTGNDGIREAKNLLTTLDKNAKVPKIICEAPPINRRMAITERRLFNATLQNDTNKSKNTTIIKTPRETENSPIEEALTDDLHLNPHHSTLLANKISEAVKEVKTKKHREEENHEIEMIIEAEEEEIKAVIGSGHSRASEMEKEYNVKIRATRNNPNKIFIHGKKDQAQQVHDVLKRRIQDQKARRERNADQRETRRRVPCIFYAQKRCIKGEKCQYLHERRRPSRERTHGRSRSPSVGKSDTRTVRIRPRSRDNE